MTKQQATERAERLFKEIGVEIHDDPIGFNMLVDPELTDREANELAMSFKREIEEEVDAEEEARNKRLVEDIQ